MLAFALGAGSRKESEEMRAHDSRCAPCRARMRAVTDLITAVRLGELESVPEDLRRSAERLLPERAAGARMKAARLGKRVVGRLRLLASSFDVAPNWSPAIAGLRNAAATARHELGSGDLRLELEWTPSGSAWTIRGRVLSLSRRNPRARIALEFSGQGRRPVSVGPRGFFGPVRGSGERLRAELETETRLYRSRWIRSPRARAGVGPPTKRKR